MKLSVIVPVYNVEKYLPQCIESILTQTYKNFELILVDDGSPDRCPQICDIYANKDSRIKVIHKSNGGSVSARDVGIRASQGDYICFVDGDDFILNDMLEIFYKELCKQKVDIVCAGYSSYSNERNIVRVPPRPMCKIYTKKELQEELYNKMLSTKPFFSFYITPHLATKCFRKEIIEKSHRDIPKIISLGDDAAATYPALLDASSISVVDYCGYMYRSNPNSMTHTYDKNLYAKIRSLVSYMKHIEAEKHWNAGNQINEYASYLLLAAKYNEFTFNNNKKYRIQKRNMKRYLCDPLFKDALKKVKSEGLRNKVILFCFRYCITLPIYVYEKFARWRRRND